MDTISASTNLIDGNWLKAIKLSITQHIACVILLSIRFRKKRLSRLKSIAPAAPIIIHCILVIRMNFSNIEPG